VNSTGSRLGSVTHWTTFRSHKCGNFLISWVPTFQGWSCTKELWTNLGNRVATRTDWFLGCLMTLLTAEVIQHQLRWEDDHEWWADKNLEEGSHDLLEGIILAFTWRDRGKSQKISVNLACNPAKVQTRYLLNTSLEYSCYTNLLIYVCGKDSKVSEVVFQDHSLMESDILIFYRTPTSSTNLMKSLRSYLHK